MRLVHETPERDIRVREVKRALREQAAQTMRIAAGAGDVRRMGEALERLNEAMDAMPDQRVILYQEEAAVALGFAADTGYFDDAIGEAVDEIGRHAHRLVASRYQDLLTQERFAESGIHDAIQHLEEAQTEARERALSTPRRPLADILAEMTLSPRMIEALAFAAVEDRNERVRHKRPHPESLAALEKRGMIARGATELDCRLTEKGREALRNVQRRRGR